MAQTAEAGTLMLKEAHQATEVVSLQRDRNAPLIGRLARELRLSPPRLVMTCARGSSDHAATYARYLFETRLGVLTASASPSISSVYGVSQNLEGTLYLVISQSGKSPDLVDCAARAKASGATVIAILNDTESPVAKIAHEVIPLHAGAELSVAATKSYIATLAAVLALAAAWADDGELQQSLDQLPEYLTHAWTLDWTALSSGLADVDNLLVIGRGLGLGVAQEVALKFKETAGIHAEAFSAAEVRHGPMAIVGRGFPVLMLAQPDPTLPDMEALANEFRRRAARVLLAAPGPAADWRLPVLANTDPAIAPILMVQSFYRALNTLSLARGFNPDQPPHLSKVTETR